MRLIDADNLNAGYGEKEIQKYGDDFDGGVLFALNYLSQNAPTVDAVEVVRCKDCRWWQLSLYNTCGIHVCQRFSGVRGEHDFCSKGERREEEQ